MKKYRSADAILIDNFDSFIQKLKDFNYLLKNEVTSILCNCKADIFHSRFRRSEFKIMSRKFFSNCIDKIFY